MNMTDLKITTCAVLALSAANVENVRGMERIVLEKAVDKYTSACGQILTKLEPFKEIKRTEGEQHVKEQYIEDFKYVDKKNQLLRVLDISKTTWEKLKLCEMYKKTEFLSEFAMLKKISEAKFTYPKRILEGIETNKAKDLLDKANKTREHYAEKLQTFIEDKKLTANDINDMKRILLITSIYCTIDRLEKTHPDTQEAKKATLAIEQVLDENATEVKSLLAHYKEVYNLSRIHHKQKICNHVINTLETIDSKAATSLRTQLELLQQNTNAIVDTRTENIENLLQTVLDTLQTHSLSLINEKTLITEYKTMKETEENLMFCEHFDYRMWDDFFKKLRPKESCAGCRQASPKNQKSENPKSTAGYTPYTTIL